MKHYYVVSPEMSEVVPVCDDGSGPLEVFCCVAEVDAPTKREAIRQAIRDPNMTEWVEQQRGDSKNPFAGLKCELYKNE